MSSQIILPDDLDIAILEDGSKLPNDARLPMRELAWRRAKADPLWFLSNLWQVMDPKSFQWSKFRLRDYQRDDALWIVEAMRSGDPEQLRKLILKARQIGWTTLASGLAFHDIFFNENHPWIIASQGEDEAKATLRTKVKVPYQRLPLWFRNHQEAPRPVDDNMEVFSLSNDSSILSVPATSSAGRSKAVYGSIIDEWAFAEKADELLAALDPLTYGPLMIFSTANGMGNAFHAKWVDSQEPGSAWDARFRPWHVVPERDEKWYEREKRKYRGKEWLFYQEHPSTPEEAFAKSGRTVIPIDLLRENGHLTPPVWRVDLQTFDRSELLTAERLVDGPGDMGHEELWVWEPPTVELDARGRLVRKPNYVIGCDVAEGLEHGDRTSIVVINANTGEEAAAYRGFWDYEELGPLLAWLGYSYHTALLLVERNNHGMVPLHYLRASGYPRIYRMTSLAQIPEGDRTPRYGWVTTAGSKPKLVVDLIHSIRDDAFVIHDERFLAEAMTFIANGKGGYEAAEGSYDDHVMGHGLAWEGYLDVGQYPPIYYHEEPGILTFGMIDKMLTDRAQPVSVGIGQRRIRQDTPSFVI